MTDTTTRGAGPAERAQHAGGDGPAPARRRRMSAGRKQSAVLRLLRGEDLELVSRELGVTAAELSAWRDAFLSRRRGVVEDPAWRWSRRGDRSPEGQGRGSDHGQRAAGDQDRAPGGRPPFGTAEVEAMSREVSPSTRPKSVLRRAAGDPGLGHVAGDAVSPSPMRRTRPAASAGPARTDAGSGAGRGDPRAAGRQPLPR